MISHFQHLEEHEGETFGPELVRARREGAARADHDDGADDRARARAARDRRRHPGSGDRVPDGHRHPGRLVTSTLLNLFVVPSLYLRFGKSRSERTALEAGMAP